VPTRRQTIRHLFGGGWATDYGPGAEVAIQGNIVVLPYLWEAENVFYELDGGPHKIGGIAKVNSTAVASGQEILGLFDYWYQGTAAAGTRHMLCQAGTTVQTSTDSGATWASKIAGLTDNAVPCFTTFNDICIYSNDSTNVPRKYTGSTATAATLGSNTPNFAFSVAHKNRLWAAGNYASANDASRVFYSQLEDADTDWAGSGAGSIQIDPDDGDRITGLASHKDDLWVFKGPYHGSIHRITGSSPTGSDSFARQTFVRGIGAVNHNSIFHYRDDIGFLAPDGTVHSLAAVAAYGDYRFAALSQPINSYLRDRVTHGSLKYAWSGNDVSRGYVLISVPHDTATTNSLILMMDYRFDPPRWAKWAAFSATAVAPVADSNLPTLWIGGSDGFVRKMQRSNRNLDGVTAYSMKVKAPYLSYGNPMQMKTLAYASVGIAPKHGNLIFTWERDNLGSQTRVLSQGAGGVPLGTFFLGTDYLGGSQYMDRYMSLEEGGEFRTIQLGVTNNAVNEDVELHSISASYELGAESTEN
jgi:hypothetical protein